MCTARVEHQIRREVTRLEFVDPSGVSVTDIQNEFVALDFISKLTCDGLRQIDPFGLEVARWV